MPPHGLVSTEPPRGRWPALPRSWATLFVVVFGSLVTAFAGLLVEGFLPTEPPGWSVGWPTNHWFYAGFIVTGLVTLYGVWSLRVRSRQRGTLYYLRLQGDTVPDLHSVAVTSAASSYLGYRSVTSWFDPGVGTVDVREQVRSMTAELQRATNDDSDDSGFDVAPSLVFPGALAMGFDWTPPREVRMREINGPRQGRNTPGFEWHLDCLTRSGAGCTPPTQHHSAVEHFIYDPASPYPRIDQRTTFKTHDVKSAIRSVWLELRLADQEFVMESDLKDRHAAAVRTVAMFPSAAEDAEPMLLRYGPVKQHRAVASVHQIAEAAAYWIGQTLTEFPAATILVAAAMPKSVALVTGHLMTRPAPSHPAGHIWRRLVPMGHFLHEPEELRPMWVRHDQTDPDHLIPALADEGSS